MNLSDILSPVKRSKLWGMYFLMEFLSTFFLQVEWLYNPFHMIPKL